jgi:polysaccharide biosynthesis/export protein
MTKCMLVIPPVSGVCKNRKKLHKKSMPTSFKRSQLFVVLLHICFLISISLTISACSSLPKSGPSAESIQQQATALPSSLQLVDITAQISRQLDSKKKLAGFGPLFGAYSGNARDLLVGIGDTIEVSIWEAPPATLFGAGDLSARGGAALGASRNTTLPEQTVGAEGKVNVPFAGSLTVAGRSTGQIESDIALRLKGKANQPQVMVRLLRNNSALATVVGEVVNNTRVPITARGERLLDAIAAAGGAKQPLHKTIIQITRGTTTGAMSLDSVIRDPQHNVALQAGDIITAAYQPLSFTALGATGKNDEINFEGQGISLAQALARVGGLQDARADAQGIFIFRLENANALTWPRLPVATTADGKVPVIYRLDMKNPASFFVAQGFMVEDKDLLYVSNAPAAELQKFANLIYTIGLPVIGTINSVR